MTPELSLWGYPPRDLLFSPTHLEQQQEALETLRSELAARESEIALLVGVADAAEDGLYLSLIHI